MKHRKNIIRLSVLLILTVFLTTGSSCRSTVAKQKVGMAYDSSEQVAKSCVPSASEAVVASQTATAGNKAALSLKNDSLELHLTPDGKNFYLRDFANGSEYFSSITDENMAGLKGVMKLKLKSIISGSYYDRKMNKETEFYSAAENVQIKTELTKKDGRDLLRLRSSLPVGLSFAMDIELVRDRLLVRIDRTSINENDRFVFKKFTLMPNLFVADSRDNGYFLLPDGCGGLLRFNNGRKGIYNEPVYGINRAFVYPAYAGRREKIYLPVYGMERNGDTALAVISQGAGCAEIFASTAGNRSKFNQAYADFVVRASDKQYITPDSFQTILERSLNLSSDLEITVLFCPRKGGYPAMAKRLKNEIDPSSRKTAITNPILISIYGGVATKGTVLGVPLYEKIEKISLPNAVNEIVDNFTDWSGCRPQLRLAAWDKNTILGYSAGEFCPIQPQREMKKFLADLKLKQINTYMSLPLLYFSRSGRGIRIKGDAIRNLANEPSKQYEYYRASSVARQDKSEKYLLNAAKLEARMAILQKSLDKWKVDGIASEDLGGMAYSDYRKDYTIDRDRGIPYFQNELTKLSEKQKLAVAGGCYYSIAAADLIYDVPISGSHYEIMDDEVPFYQMVLSGIRAYCGPSINQVGNRKKVILQALETGSCLQYSLAGEISRPDDVTVKELLYGGNWLTCRKQIKDELSRYGRDLQRVAGVQIDNHEILPSGLHRTTFAGGVVVLVNYTDKIINWGTREFAPLSYVIEGGK